MGYALGLVLGALPFVLATLPPFVPEPFRGWLMAAFTPMCHQLPGRSWHVDGVALAVCHRCYGIYAALPLGGLLLLALRPLRVTLDRHAKLVLLGALTVPGLDWVGGLLGWWASTPGGRAATGAVFGLVAGYYLAHACAGLLRPKPA